MIGFSNSRIALGLRLLFLVLTSAYFSLATDTNRIGQEDHIREVVFRYQFEHNASGQQKRAHAFCLALGEKGSDPAEQLMKRFAHHRPPVRKASACHVTSSGEVIDNHTNESALIFFISSITWISDSEVKAEGGYEEGNVSSSGNTYTVRKQNSKWEVTDDKMNSISQNFPAAGVPPPHSRVQGRCS
jgi:hypothetical protein